MRIGTESPQWAKNLLFKWVVHDDPYYKTTLICFIWHTDYFESNDSDRKVRIFFDEEESVRNSLAGTEPRGLAASFICEDKYKVIETPAGLEDWTASEIEFHKRVWKNES